MAFFDGQLDEFTVGTVLSNPEFLPQELQKQMKSELALGMDKDAVTVEAQTEAGFLDVLEQEARSTNLTNLLGDIRLKTEEELVNGVVDTEAVSERARMVAEVESGGNPSSATWLFKNEEDNIFQNTNKIALYRMERAKRIFQKRFEDSSGGFWNGLGYFLDAMVSSPKDVLEGGGFTRSNWAEQIISMANDPSMSAAEFDQRVEEIVTDVSDAGIFTDNNWFYSAQFMDDLVNDGGNLDKLFTAVDAIGLGLTVKGVKNVFKLRKTSDIAAANAPQENVVRNLEQTVTPGTADVEDAMIVSPAVSRPMDTSFHNGFFSAANRQFLVERELDNGLLDTVTREGYGFFIQPEVWERVAPALRETIRDRALELSSRRLLDLGEDTVVKGTLDNPIGIAYFGTTKGKLYNPVWRAKAQAYADEIGGTVVEVPQEGKTMLAVRKEWNLPTEHLFDPISEDEITTSLFSILSSTNLTTSQRLDRIIKLGESQLSNTFNQIFTDYNKVKRGASKETRDFVDQLNLELRDGLEATRREPLSTPEFIDRFNQRFGTGPSTKDIAYYEMTQEMNDTAYFLMSDPIFKDAVNAGAFVINREAGDGFPMVVREATENLVDRSQGRTVWNLDTSEPMDLPANLKGVYQVDGYHNVDGLHYKFVYSEKAVRRRLYHTDVLGYNAGGPRVYDEFKHFIGQEDELAVAGGRSAKHERIFMGARTEKEAAKAVDEINSLFEELRRRIPGAGTKFNDMQRLRNLAGIADFEQFVARNTRWNANINSVDDLADFLESRNINFRNPIIAKGDREPLAVEANFFSQSGPPKAGEAFTRAASRQGRSDAPLIGYGGDMGSTLAPHVAVQRNFTRALTAAANAPYVKNAVSGWLRGVEDHLTAPLKGDTPFERFRTAQVRTSTKAGRAFEQERRIILRRVANEDGFTRYWQSMMSSIADWVYDKGAKKMGVSIENQFSSNPAHFMRSVAFNLKLGLFAFPQLIVQSNQAVNVAAIGGVNGFRGAIMTPALHLAMYNGTKPVAKFIAKTAGPVLGIKPADFEEMIEMLKRSGRFSVGREVIEQDMGLTLASSKINRVLEAGRIPFNEGERFARTSAAAVAYLDFKKKFPGVSVLSERGQLWTIQRMDKLTASMTSASAAPWQRNSLTAVPFQFMSYTARMFESLFSNKILTPAERVKLGSAQVMFWGLTGAGVGWALDKQADKGRLEGMSQEEYQLIRYGLLDFMIFKTTGARTAWADRLSFPGAVLDLWEKITDKKFLEVVGGASVQTGSSLMADVMLTMGDAWHGRWSFLPSDASLIASNLSSVSASTRAYHLFSTGKYFSRRGEELGENFNNAEAFFNLLGAPLQEINAAYDIRKDRAKERRALDEMGKLLQTRMVQATQAIGDGENDKAKSMLRDIAVMIAPYEPYEREYLKRFLKPRALNMLEQTIKKELESLQPDDRLRLQILGEDIE